MSWDKILKEDEVTDDERYLLMRMLYRVELGDWDLSALHFEIYKPMTKDRHNEIERYLLDNTPCAIAGGFNYNMGDITRKLNREL